MVKIIKISEISISPGVVGDPDANPPVPTAAVTQKTGATLEIKNAQLYFPVVALSMKDNIKFSKIIKQGFKRTISWNK